MLDLNQETEQSDFACSLSLDLLDRTVQMFWYQQHHSVQSGVVVELSEVIKKSHGVTVKLISFLGCLLMNYTFRACTSRVKNYGNSSIGLSINNLSFSFRPPRKGEGNFLAFRFSLCSRLGTSFICTQLMFERFPLQNVSGSFSSLQSFDFVNANDSHVREGVDICLFPSPSLSASEKVSHLMFFKFSPEDLLDKDFTFLTHLVSSNMLSYLWFFSFPGSATKEYKLCTVEKVHFFVLLKTKQKKKPTKTPKQTKFTLCDQGNSVLTSFTALINMNGSQKIYAWSSRLIQ